MTKPIKFEIDGTPVEAAADETIWQVARRNGTEKAVRLMQQQSWDVGALTDLAIVMADSSICGLGQAAPNPLLSVLKHFPEDLS